MPRLRRALSSPVSYTHLMSGLVPEVRVRANDLPEVAGDGTGVVQASVV